MTKRRNPTSKPQSTSWFEDGPPGDPGSPPTTPGPAGGSDTQERGRHSENSPAEPSTPDTETKESLAAMKESYLQAMCRVHGDQWVKDHPDIVEQKWQDILDF